MFDLSDDTITEVKRRNNPLEDNSLYGKMDDEDEDAGEDSGKDDLDSADNVELHKRLLAFYQNELDRQEENRVQMSIDADYYDHVQWSEQDSEEIMARGQEPLVYNVVSQACNWIIGSEKKGRVDYKVLPRGPEDAVPAQRKTKMFKYVTDINRTQFHRSRAFEDSVKVGIGWMECGIQDDSDEEMLFERYESWRNMLWDSSSTEMDLKDARYVIRSKWIDEDIAITMFPDRADIIKRSAVENTFDAGNDHEYGDQAMDSQEETLEDNVGGRGTDSGTRPRVRMIEIWYKKPIRRERLQGGKLNGDTFDAEDEQQQEEIQSGRSVVNSLVQMRVCVAVMAMAGLCYNDESPYKHNRYPFTPIFSYRRDRDNLPYGTIRGMRDVQKDINKRASKALYIMSTNKIMMEKGAVDDIDELREEAARPDAIIEYKKGYALDLNVDRGLEETHLRMMERDIAFSQTASGVTDELQGKTTNAQSGIAVQRRQEQGMMSTAKLFDNLRLAFQIQGEKVLSLMEQYYSEEKVFRITNERGTPEFVTVNDGLPENDIVNTKADFIVFESEWRASIREAQAEKLADMMGQMPPEVAIILLDLVVEAMDLPNAEEIVKRIRQINGQRDPDATEITEEEQAAMEDQAQQKKMQNDMVQAELRKKMAEAGKTEAEQQAVLSKLNENAAAATNRNMDSQTKAIEAAKEALAYPQVTRIADKLMREFGFVSQTEKEATEQAAAADQQRQAAMEEQAMMEEQAQQEQQAAMEEEQTAMMKQQQQGQQQQGQQQQPTPGMTPGT